MMEIISSYKVNIILDLAFFILLLSFLFPLEEKISKLLKTEVKKSHIFLILITLVLIVLANVSTLGFALSLPMILFSFLVFLFGMLSNRKYIYLLALISLALTPVMLIVKLENIAEFFAQTCYLLLVLGVLKDIFYEKIFE